MPKLSSMIHSKIVKITTTETLCTKKICTCFYLMHLKTLTEVGAPGDIGQSAVPPVAI